MLMNPATKPSAWTCAALLACLAPAGCLAGDDGLVGCWRSISITQHLADGRSKTDASGACTLEVLRERIVSSCLRDGERTGTEYTYRIVRPGTYEATIVANARRPDTVGGTREYDYRIAGDRLFITTYPQTTVPAPASRAVRVESESARVGCAPAGHAD